MQNILSRVGMMRFRKYLVLLLAAVVFLGGCANPTASNQVPTNPPPISPAKTTPTVSSTPNTPSPPTNQSTNQSPNQSSPTQNRFNNLARLEGKATVVLQVKGAAITIELDGTNAPLTAGNFLNLVQKGVYDGLIFHRVVREPQPFVVQGGDPQGKNSSFPVDSLGTGGFVDPATGRPRNIPLEIKPRGATEPLYSQTFPQAGVTVPPMLQHTRGAVAMARSQSADSASSQFYIALADLPFLDGSYAVFGYVTSGMDVVDQIQRLDRIESAKITQGLENLKS